MTSLPLLCLEGWTQYRAAQAEAERARQQVFQLAQVTASETAKFLAQARSILGSLAARPAVRSLDPARCDPLLADFRALQPRFANAATMRLDGTVVCSAAAMPGPTRMDPERMIRLLRGPGELTIGQITPGTITGRRSLPLGVPLHDAQGATAGAIGLAVDLVNFPVLPSVEGLPPKTIVGIIAADGTILARSAEAERYVGSKIVVGRPALTQKSGTADVAGLDGVARVQGFTPIPGTDWIALASMPADEVYADTRERLLQAAVLAAALLSLSVWLALRLSRRTSEGAQTGLLESEERFRLVTQATNDAVWDWDLVTDALWWNDGLRTLFGHAPGEVEPDSRSWINRIHPEDRERVAGGIHAVIDGAGTAWTDEYRFQRKDGTFAHVHDRGNVIRDARGKAVRMIGAMADITARKGEEQVLRESEARYRALAETSPDAILIHQDMKVVFANKALVELMRARDAAQLVGRSATVVVRPEYEASARERIAALYAGKSLPRTEQVYARLDGTTVPVEIAAAPILFEGRPAGQVTVRDITDRVRERALVTGQSAIMEKIAAGAPLADTLRAIVDFIEADSPDMLASILLLDGDGVHVRHGAAGRLPAAYCRAVDGQPIGPKAGSCGTAMYRGEQVVVADIATDPLWEDYRALAAAHDLRACWSTPIIDAARRVLGSFALYFRAPGRPNERDQQLIRMATHTAAIAIARHRSAHELAASEATFRSVFENSAIGMTMTDPQGRLIRCNPAFCRMLGYEPAELAGRAFADLTHPADVEENQRLYRALVAGEIDHFQMEKRYRRKDGEVVWVQLNVSQVAAGEGVAPFTIGMMEDITASHAAQEALSESESRYRGILESMSDGFVAMDRGLRFTYVNPRAEQILGREAASLLGQPYLEAFPAAAGTPFEDAYRRALAEGVSVESEHFFEPWQRWFAQRVDPTPEGISVFFRDTTERRKSASRIEYLATHDELTGLPNRTLMHDRITQALAHARRAERQCAVLFLDLDRFKVINDAYGHPFGDAVLKESGARLTGLVREGDTIARHAGDGFLVLLSDLRQSTDAYVVAQKILDAFAQPYRIDAREVFVSASIGVSTYPQDGQSADALLGNAEAAMYRAKELGRNTYQFFTRDMSEQTHRRVEIETALRSAIAKNELHLVYQPKLDLASGRINGCEALLRWTHPALGVVSPARFIPVAEDSGLIVPIGDWVLRTACVQARAWLAAGLPPLTVSVNLSARQFLQQDVVAWVSRVLEETGMPAGQLELELTESMIAQDAEKAIATVQRLKALGVRLAIDDFGTGYSNLSQLKRFRVDALKIDQSFVRALDSDVDDATIVLAVITLAHNLRMSAVAEGVETEAQWRFLRLNRCDAMQGYYFSKPVPAAEMQAMLAEGRKLHNAVKP